MQVQSGGSSKTNKQTNKHTNLIDQCYKNPERELKKNPTKSVYCMVKNAKIMNPLLPTSSPAPYGGGVPTRYLPEEWLISDALMPTYLQVKDKWYIEE